MPRVIRLRAFLFLAFMMSACTNQSSQEQAVKQKFPDMDSTTYAVFAQQCSACHAPPQPIVHTAAEWERVVRRMQSHRIQRGLGPMSKKELRDVLSYLQTHARKGG